jgi:tellurite resistance protein
MATKQWILRDLWGFQTDIPENDLLSYAKALLVCVNADGTLAKEEREWVVGYCAAVGAEAATIEEVSNYSAEDDLVTVVRENPNLAKGYVRPLIFDAIKACAADGTYSEEEQAAVRKLAALLGLNEQDLEKLEDLHHEEQALKQKRISIVYPDGRPF